MKLLRLGIYLFFTISLSAGVWLSATEAAEVTWNPRVDARLKYDDNINFSSHFEEQDWIYEIRPELKWRRRTDQNDFSLSAQLLGQKYDTHTDLDTLDQYYRLKASSRVRPTVTLFFDASYRKDTTQDSELSEEGLRLWRDDRKEYRLNPSMHWQATERSSWEMALPFRKVNYEGDIGYGLYEYENQDHRTAGISLRYNYLLADERTYVYVNPSFSNADFDDGETDSYNLMCGIDRAFSERLNLRAGAGIYYSNITDDIEGTSNETGFLASIEAYGNLERGTWRAGYLKDVYPSGIGETVDRNRVTLNGMYRLSERMRLTGNASYTDVSSQGDEDNEDYWTVDIRPGLVYRLTEHANIGLYYQHRFLDDQRVDRNTTRNLVWISLNFYSRLEDW